MWEQNAIQPGQIKRRSLPPNQQQGVPRTNTPPASPHRAGHHAGLHPEDQPYTTMQRQRPRQQPMYDTEDDDAIYTTRSPRSAIALAPRGRTFVEPVTTNHTQQKKPFVFPGWLIVIGIAVIVMIIGYLAFTFIGSQWQHWQDDLHFGKPRTYQIDAVVGHNDSVSHPSHFIALNLNGHIKVIELPGGNSKDSHIFDVTLLEGEGAQYIPVTLSFQDDNHNGKPNMFVTVGNATYIFTNTGTTFTLATQP